MSLSDVTCSICLEVLIEPVKMPCKHEICLECFSTMLDKTNLQCPMCRMRISTWARTATNNHTLVDQERWKFIQSQFGTEIRNRREGKTAADLMETVSHMVPAVKAVLVESKRVAAATAAQKQTENCAKPGEIGKEYQEYLRKEAERLQREKENEEQLSLAYIKSLIEREEAVTVNDYIQMTTVAAGVRAQSTTNSNSIPNRNTTKTANAQNITTANNTTNAQNIPIANNIANTPNTSVANSTLNANIEMQPELVVSANTVMRSASRMQGRRPVMPKSEATNNDSVFENSPMRGAGRGRARKEGLNAPVNRLHQRIMANESAVEPAGESEAASTSTRRVTRSQSLRQARPAADAAVAAATSSANDCSTASARRRRADESIATVHELDSTTTSIRSKKAKK